MEKNNNIHSEPETVEHAPEPNMTTPPPPQAEVSTVTDKPLKVMDYLIMLIVIAIPVVNIIALLKWSFKKGVNVNKRNFARASLIVALVSLLIIITIPMLLPAPETLAEPAGGTNWFREELTAADIYGFIPSSFKEDLGREITREEMARLAVMVYEKAKGETVVPADPNPFNDTDNTHVLKAAAVGIASSSPGQAIAFNPSGNVSRQEMSVILLRTINALGTAHNWDTQTHTPFADQNEIQDWAQEAVNFTYNYGIISAHENRIAPLMTLNREEAVLCAKRVYELAVEGP